MPQSFGMDRVRVLMPDEYNGYPWSFFTHNVGNSWHGADAQLIFWVCLLLHDDVWSCSNLGRCVAIGSC